MKLSCLAVSLGVCLAALGCEPTNQGYQPAQPIEYSHAIHAGAMKIDCLYCHYAAERGRHAGIPPATVCMNCHAQVKTDHPEVRKVARAVKAGEPIEWVRIHQVPDHVYFNHSAHVNGGVECQKCHGPVESMGRVEQWAPLTMGWCLDCHRESGAGLADVPEDHDVRSGPLTDCFVCHH